MIFAEVSLLTIALIAIIVVCAVWLLLTLIGRR